MLPRDSRYSRHGQRAIRRTNLTALEQLEARELLAFSNLGFSLPDLIISGEAGPRAAWGGTLSISGYVQNIGASTITEPTQQAPGASSTSDAPVTSVAVYLSPRRHSLRGSMLLATLSIPPIGQNSVYDLNTAPINLPPHPKGFAGPGGVFYVRLMANSSGTAFETNPTNNISSAIPVKVVGQALPELRAIALGVPPVMQPGDTISPTIEIENFGTAGTLSQGSVDVALVYSLTPTFTAGSTIFLPVTTISTDIPALSDTPTKGNPATFGEQNLIPPKNVVTFTMAPVTLPVVPGYLGVVIDPYGTLNQLSLPKNALEQIHRVGSSIPNLPPAGVVSSPNTGVFPTPANGQLIGNLNS